MKMTDARMEVVRRGAPLSPLGRGDAAGRLRRSTTAIALVSMLLALILCGPAPAQRTKSAPAYDGTHLFANWLHEKNLQPIKNIADLPRYPPHETLIVAFGDLSALREIRAQFGSLVNFQKKGGSLLIASERQSKGLLRDFNLGISGHRILGGPNYLNLPQCPLIRESLKKTHPVFNGVTRGIAANKPSEIRVYPGATLRVLADYSLPDQDPGFRSNHCFIVGSPDWSQDEGRVLIIAGHGVFINAMLIQRDIDNKIFADNCLNWLTNGGTKKYCLFIEEHKVHTQFQVPLTRPPFPPPGEEKINRLLHILQEENMFNEMLLRMVPRNDIIRMLLLSLSLLVFARLVYRSFAGRHARESGLQFTSRTLELTTSDQPLMAQRWMALARQNNLAEAAGTLARQWLEAHGVAEKGKAAPRVEAAGWWQRRRWQQNVNYLWQLAWGDARRVNPHRFRILVSLLEKASTAARQGDLRLKPG